MKNITEIDTSQYEHYGFTKCKTNMSMFLEHTNDDSLYTNYDLYESGEYAIIAFKDDPSARGEYSFKIVSDEGVDYVQSDLYENNSDFINNDYDRDNTVFLYLDSVLMSDFISSGSQLGLHKDRCDLEKFGAAKFTYSDNGLGQPDLNSVYHNTDNKIETKFFILSSIKNFHVIKMQWKDYPDAAYKNCNNVVSIARTFVGIIKMIIEWSEVAKEPWNSTERKAISAINGLNKLSIPQEVIDEVNEYQVDMPVKLFLQNDPNCRGSLEEKSELPPLFKKWYLSKIRYGSLSALATQNDVSVPVSIIEAEKRRIYTSIYEFFLLQGVNTESHTLAELMQMIDSGQFKSDLDGVRQIRDELKKRIHF